MVLVILLNFKKIWYVETWNFEQLNEQLLYSHIILIEIKIIFETCIIN